MIDITAVLSELALQRQIFHSEADFQHALAWEIQRHLPSAAIRLEFPLVLADQQAYIDIWIRQANAVLALELKCKTRALSVIVGGEKYRLKDQSAQDIARYDFAKDIQRLEQALAEYGQGKGVGYAILLTNDSAYWKLPRNNRTVDVDFRLHVGRVLSGVLGWRGAGKGTTRGRESPIVLKHRYPIKWHDYSRLNIGGYNRFRYLAVRVVP